MLLEDLPTEVLINIYVHIPTVASVIALASTCHRFSSVHKSSKRLSILEAAAEQEFGPIHDIIQLVTYNTSQPTHIARTVPLSDALIRLVLKAGRVAAQWEQIYPFKKWKADFANRRLLDDHERRLLRRAIYRIWLYSKAFHNMSWSRGSRLMPGRLTERALFLHNFRSGELAEMLDAHNMLRDTISNNICPSNGTIKRKFDKVFPGSKYQLLFNMHQVYPSTSGLPEHWTSDEYYTSDIFRALGPKTVSRMTPTKTYEPGAEGWGDDVPHYYVVEDMLKLDPEQILTLRNKAPLKRQVEDYIHELGDWFGNNGETFCQTMAHVIHQRGEEMDEIRSAMENGVLGIALCDGI